MSLKCSVTNEFYNATHTFTVSLYVNVWIVSDELSLI